MLARSLELACDPLQAFEAASDLPGLAFLHSGVRAYGLGRYSILAARPWKRFTYRDGWAEVEEAGEVKRERKPLFTALEEELGRGSQPEQLDLPFHAGAIGYVAYEAGRYLEKVELSAQEPRVPDACFGFYRSALVFDHQEAKVWAVGSDQAGLQDLEELAARAQAGDAARRERFRLAGGMQSNFTRERYLRSVEQARRYIRQGEVYQINLAQRFAGPCKGSAADLYHRLARRNPAPYAAYLDFGDEQIVCSSPERFLTLRGRRVATRPIKGTRSAGGDDAEAEVFARELATSEKDRSELLMIVDLERNDLGRVCRPRSVRVEGLFAQERYATVIHQTAEVLGELEDGLGPIDCFKAMFPGGSITGAPKIRAMEIIAELEKRSRGINTGAIGYFDASGGADFNIAIRTIRIANGEVSYHVGGGIVWDSDPEAEYEETLLKGKAMKTAIENRHG